MLERLHYYFFKKISPKGLAIFRIAYSFIFLLEVITIFNYRQLYYDSLPYLTPHFPDTGILFIFWMIVLVFLILGYYTRIATIINYIFTLVFISSAVQYEYHMFYVYSGMNFLLIFLPIYSSISIDALRKKLRYIKQGLVYKEPKVAKINYLVPVFIALGLVYFDSVIFYKIQSPMWLRGLGLWLPSSLPHVTIAESQWFLNQEILMKILSYVTLYFEFVFIFLFWNKRFRIPILITGVALHLGIFVEYPIPYFGLGCATIYILMVPVHIWTKFWEQLFMNKENFKVYYNESHLSSQKFKVLVESLDICNRIQFIAIHTLNKSDVPDKENTKLEIYGIDKDKNRYSGELLINKIAKKSPLCYLIIILDKFFLYKNPLVDDSEVALKFKKFIPLIYEQDRSYQFRDKARNTLLILFFFFSCLSQVQVHYSFFNTRATTLSINHFLVSHFGICPHPVFMDSHFKGYTNVYGVKYNNQFLPILDEKGMPSTYLSGGTWVNWMWRVNRPYVKEDTYSLQKGIVDYSSFWMHTNEIHLSERQEFEIVRKKIKVNFQWEKDLLNNNIATPWEKVGILRWEGRNAKFLWDSNEKK